MKTGKKMKQVKESIEKSGQKAVMIENCGMPSGKNIPVGGRNPGRFRILFSDHCERKLTEERKTSWYILWEQEAERQI